MKNEILNINTNTQLQQCSLFPCAYPTTAVQHRTDWDFTSYRKSVL